MIQTLLDLVPANAEQALVALVLVALGAAGSVALLAKAAPHLPRPLVKAGFRGVLRLVYGAGMRGAENLERAGERRVVVANHLSFLDGIFLGAFLPGNPVFAVDTRTATRWWAKPFLSLVDHFPLDPTNPMAMKALAREVERGRTLVIFPEGRLTVTGSLMKVYDGPAMVSERVGADVVPVRLDGLQHGLFTRLRGRVARHLLPKVTMTVLEPRRLAVDPALRGRARRKAAGQQLHDLMASMVFRTSDADATLFASLAEAARTNGRGTVAVQDPETSLTYGRLLAGALALGKAVRPLARPGDAVGVMLPNSSGAVATFFALQAEGMVPAMLNVSAGPGGMAAACRVAAVRTVLTSRRFVEKGKLGDAVAAISGVAEVVYLEDLRQGIGPLDRLAALARSRFPDASAARREPTDPAVILFTSGSEGTPKGVVLSHRNVNANRHQVSASIAFNTSDVVFNAMPMFHSFGLTVGTLLPILSGIRTYLYPSPLHYRVVPELVYQTNATVFFATDTFLRGYARTANPYDFRSVRIVGAGAERVSEETRRTWADRFGVRILEGYGMTEASPVVAFNTPMHCRPGTVGRLMPGLEARLEPVPGIEGAGRLHLRGPNVMLGYMRDTAPGVVEALPGGWHDSGDVVAIDAEGFVSIRGRAKRFAKVAGEMVSLAAVEELAAAASPGHRHAALARPDARKGEAIILVSENPVLRRDVLLKAAAAKGLPEIMVPRDVLAGRTVPVTGTGKTDYVELTRNLDDERTAA